MNIDNLKIFKYEYELQSADSRPTSPRHKSISVSSVESFRSCHSFSNLPQRSNDID